MTTITATHLLEVREGCGEAQFVAVSGFPFWIGRDPRNQLALHSSVVSRRHASIEECEGRLYVVDNGSRNGILVNGEPVPGRREFDPGDVLGVGPFNLCLRLAAKLTAEDPSGGTIAFYPPQPSWDPFGELATAILPAKQDPVIPWQNLCRLLLEGDAQAFFEMTLEIIEQIVSFDRCFLVLLRGESLDAPEIAAERFARSFAAGGSTEVYVSRRILQRVMLSGEAVIVSTEQKSFDPSESFIQSGARSLICIPLVRNRYVQGVLYLDRLVEGRPFSEEVVQRLAPLSGLIALRIENQRLVEAQLEARVHKRELEAARSVQASFLPRRISAPLGYELEAFSRPCFEVGGDCLDVIDRGGGRLDFLVGDVTGTGLPAALYMVGVVSTVRAHLIDGFELEDVMTRLESHVCSRFHPEHFLTAVLGELEVASGRLTFCNAGHPFPVLFATNGRVAELEERDPALNVASCDVFRRIERKLAPGELALVYTDGLTEWTNAEGESFGRERLIACVREHLGEELAGIRGAILAALEGFGPHRPGDDVTFLLLRREGGAGGV